MSSNGNNQADPEPAIETITIGDEDGLNVYDDTITLGGYSYRARLVEWNNSIVVYYDAKMEAQAGTQQGKLNALNQVVAKAGYGGSNKDVQYEALP